MIQVSESDDGREVDVVVGETVELALPETSGTGYRWVLASHGEPTLALEREYYADPVKTPGSRRTHYWHFKAIAAGAVQLELKYERPWETTATRSFRLKLRIETSH
jgi:predicted secreted protein